VAVPDVDAEAAGAPVNDTIPKEGATGWADTWMLAANAPDPNCAYKWMAYMSTPKIQAEDAISYGETPANTLACPIMNTLEKGGCAAYHANAPQSYFTTIKFWKTRSPRVTTERTTALALLNGNRPGRRSRGNTKCPSVK